MSLDNNVNDENYSEQIKEAISQHNADFMMLFASNVHDIKNSLSLLLGALDETALCSVEGCPTKPKLSDLKYQGKLVNDRIIQLLELYKIGNSQYTINIDYHVIREFLEEIVMYFNSMLGLRNVQIEIDCPNDLCWFFDRDLIAGVLHNAMNNAARYTNQKILIAVERQGDFLVIRVDDDGRGYPKHILDQDEQIRKQPNLSLITGSTGLGIYFSDTIAKMHKNNNGIQGKTRLENGGRYGGASFVLELP